MGHMRFPTPHCRKIVTFRGVIFMVMPMVAEPPELKRFDSRQRAAALMLSLGQKYGAPIWDQLSVEEMKELSSAMAQLGRVPASVIERLLAGIMPEERVKEIMEDIRGPSGRTMWDKLSN